jgi:hypothetical protein
MNLLAAIAELLAGLFAKKPDDRGSNPLGLAGPAVAEPPPAAPETVATGDFARAVAFVLRHEGGRVDDIYDRGGRTNMGITQRTYDAFNAEKGAYGEDVFDMTETEAEAIYRSRYWSPDCDTLSWPLSLVHFDSSVLFGVKGARERFLRTTQDPLTYINLRRAVHHQIVDYRPDQVRYLSGWLRRCDELQKEAGV